MKAALLFCCVILLHTAFVYAKVRIDVSQESKSKTVEAFEPTANRLLIRNAKLRLEVLDTRNAIARLQELIAERNGFVISLNTNSSDQNRVAAAISVRVPAQVFDKTIEEIESLSSRVISTSTYGNDITDDVARISYQIENRKESREPYRDMLKRAKKVDEVIAVERYFAEVRQDIERLEAVRQSLKDKISLLTIEIEFQQPEEQRIVDDSDVNNVGTGVGRNLTGAANILDIGISFLSSAIPIILFLLIPAYFLFKLSRKYKVVKKEESPREP